MHKKLLIGLVLAMTLIFSFTFCYAENETGKNMVNNAENAVEDAGRNAGEMVQGAANAVKDGAQNLGNTIQDGANAAGRAVENGANNAKNAMENTFAMDNNDGNGDYTATQTSGEGTFMGMTSNTWSWLILGIAAIAIIALVWYYSMQLNNTRNHDDND